MRQGQQNRRGRGRSRRGQSPLTRSFESNGPDVKIRGTAAHIGEKYLSLARDANAAGDHVLAENYLQHAEHYNRIIMAFREQAGPHGQDMANGMGRHRAYLQDFSDAGDDGDDGDYDEHAAAEAPVPRHNEPQPRLAEGHSRHDDHAARRSAAAYNRLPRDSERRAQVVRRNLAGERQGYGAGELPVGDNVTPLTRQDMAMRRRERYQPPREHEQPEFLRRPVRRPRREPNGTASGEQPAGGAGEDGDGGE